MRIPILPALLLVSLSPLTAAQAQTTEKAAAPNLKNAPRPATDSLLEDSGPFGVAWGSFPAAVRERLGRFASITEVPVRGTPFLGMDNVASFTMRHDGHSYALETYFDPDSSGFTLITLNAETTAACSALESRLMNSLGEGDKTVTNESDDKGTYQTNTRAWLSAGRRAQFVYTFIPANNTGPEYCLFAMLDGQADLPYLANTDDGEVLVGDLILAHETCAREAAEKGVSCDDHATHLIVHGTLHLLGYDHEISDADAEAMEALEIKALASLGILDPYQDGH